MGLRLLSLIALLAVGACAKDRPALQRQKGDPPLAVVPLKGTELPAPKSTDLMGDARPYLIGPFDKLAIDVFGIEGLSREVQTDSTGSFAFPLIGTVNASGKTPLQIAGLVTERLRQHYIRDPQVTVNLKETVSQIVTVDGQVNQPGLYPVIGHMTLVRAIATARGTTEFAKLDDVVVFRKVGDQRYAALYNLSSIRRGFYPDPEIYAHDVIVVGDSPGRRLFKDLIQASPLLTTPLIVAFQRF